MNEVTDADVRAGAETTDDGGRSGSGKPSWMSNIPESLRENEVLARFPTIGDASQKLIDLTAASENALTIPGEDATDGERAAFFSRLGRPESPEAYTFEAPEDWPGELPWDDSLYKQWAFELGLTDAQATGLLKRHGELMLSQYRDYIRAGEDALEKTRTALRRDWGGDYARNVELADRAAREFGGEEFAQYVKDSGLDREPAFVRFAHAVGRAMAEDSAITGQRGGETERTIGDTLYPENARK